MSLPLRGIRRVKITNVLEDILLVFLITFQTIRKKRIKKIMKAFKSKKFVHNILEHIHT